MEVAEILKSFERWPDALPREALREAAARREEIAPELLRALERALNESALTEDGDYTPQFFAMYLLAQFRDSRAYPLIVELFAKHGAVLAEWTGDFVTEGLARVLASVSGGDAGPMKRLAEDRGVDEWVRCAALSGLVVLVSEGMMPRDEAMAYYAGLLRGGLEREHSVVWEGLAGCCLDLCPEEVYEDLKRALEEKLVDPVYAKIDYIRECRAAGKDRAMRELRESGRGLIGDVVEELEDWYCFKPREEDDAEDGAEEAPDADDILDALSDRAPSGRDNGTYVRPDPKVGRNDPCPCGSGKKYKRCCGIPGAASSANSAG